MHDGRMFNDMKNKEEEISQKTNIDTCILYQEHFYISDINVIPD